MQGNSSSKNALARTSSDRVGLILFSLLIWAIAAWMFWIVWTFADGRTWWDFAVKLVLHDLIFATVVFGVALVAHAFFPRLTQPFLEKTGAQLSFLLSAIILLVVATLVFVSIVLPVLLHFGLLK